MDVDYLLDPNNLILSECSARSSEIESEKVYLKFRSQISYIQIRNDGELGNNFSRNCEEKNHICSLSLVPYIEPEKNTEIT